MAYKHGVHIYEQPTSIVPPVRTSAGLPVVFGTAPINMGDVANVNKPVLCYTYTEAVQAMGYSNDWASFTLCEFIKSHFALFACAPVVLVNVLDPAQHTASVSGEAGTVTGGKYVLAQQGVLTGTVVVKNSDGTTTHVLNTDYTVAFDDDGTTVISITDGSSIAEGAIITVDYDHLDATLVTTDDIIGGIDVTTGAPEGLELVNEIFPRFRLIPGLICAPGWSHEPAVAAVMAAKAGNINSHFKAVALTDVPTDTVSKYTDVAAWKNNNNYVDELQVVCWPKVKLGDEVFHLSTQLAGLIAQTDAANEDVPYVSPSNKNLQMVAAVVADGTEVWLGPDAAAYLNGQGIVTALNFIGGWKCWGNRTGCYPGVTDVKDAMLPIRRMFNWIGNTLVQTFWQKVDYPINRRLVETIVDSANIWLNGLAARQFILGGRVAFLPEENPATDLMDGIIKFHVYVTPPSPAREIDFILEYDPQYLETLFG
jgi:hypothetical protein